MAVLLVASLLSVPAFADNLNSSEDEAASESAASVPEDSVDNQNTDKGQISDISASSAENEQSSLLQDEVLEAVPVVTEAEQIEGETSFFFQADNAYLAVADQLFVGTELRVPSNKEFIFEANPAEGFAVSEVKAYAGSLGGPEIILNQTEEGVFKVAESNVEANPVIFIEVKTETEPHEGAASFEEVAARSLATLEEESSGEDSEEAEPAEVSYVVTFNVEGEEVVQKEVLEGTLVKPLENPSNPNEDGSPFHAWYEEGASIPFDFTQPIIKDVVLNAVFSTDHVVTFTNYAGAVLENMSVEDNTHLSDYELPVPGLPTGLQFDGWSEEVNGSLFLGVITEDITLYPVASKVSVAVFVTGGPLVPAQTGSLNGFTPEKPSDSEMVRDGYTFSHWSLVSNESDEAYDFDSPLTDQVTYIYAVWKPEAAGYILNFWTDKLDEGEAGANLDGYELVYTKTIASNDAKLAGKSGEKLNTSETEGVINAGLVNNREYKSGGAAVWEVLDYCDFAWTDAHEKELSGSGDTVINVYTTRIVYTYDLMLQKSATRTGIYTQIETSSGTISGNEVNKYSMQVKIGQNIEGIWPLSAEAANPTQYSFINWDGYYGNGTATVNPGYLQRGFSNDKDYKKTERRTTKTYAEVVPTYSTANYFEQRVYYGELSSTEYDEAQKAGLIDSAIDSKDQSQIDDPTGAGKIVKHTAEGKTRYYKLMLITGKSAQTGWNPSGWPGRAIDGYKTIYAADTKNYQVAKTLAEMNKTTDKLGYITYYMPAFKYEVNLVAGMGDSAGATIADAQSLGYSSTATGYKKEFSYGETLVLPSANLEKEGYEFEGWYLDENYMNPFYSSVGKPTYESMPGKNITLYGKLSGNSIEVNYYAGVGSSDSIAVGQYGSGESLSVSDLEGTSFEGVSIGDTVEGYGVFRGWFYYPNNDTSGALVAVSSGMLITGNPGTSYKFYADFEAESEQKIIYQVTFVGLTEEGLYEDVRGELDVSFGARNTLAGSGVYESDLVALAGDRTGYTFTGWNTQEDGKGSRFNTASRVSDNVTVYAQWLINEYPYEIHHVEVGNKTHVLEDESGKARFGEQLEATSFVREDIEGYEYEDNSGDLVIDTEDNELYIYYAKVADVVAPPSTPDTEVTNPGTEGSASVPTPEANAEPAPEVSPEAPGEAAPEATPEEEGGVKAPAAPKGGTGNNTDQEEISDADVPLGSFDTSGAWSLLSLILAILAISVSAIAIVWNIIRRISKKEEEIEEGRGLVQGKSFLLGAITIMLGVLPLLVFLIVDDMALSAVWINANTAVVTVFFGVFVLAGLAYLLVKRFDKKDDDREQGALSSRGGASLA